MIKIDDGIASMTGTMGEIFSDIGTLFEAINIFLDRNDLIELDIDVEKIFTSNDDVFKEFCKLAIRLNEAHKRYEQEGIIKNDID